MSRRQPDEPSGYYYPAEEHRWRRGLPNRRIDWLIGIVLGIALGIAVVVAFLFFGSEDTIDAPSISGVDSGKPAQQAPAGDSPPPRFSSP